MKKGAKDLTRSQTGNSVINQQVKDELKEWIQYEPVSNTKTYRTIRGWVYEIICGVVIPVILKALYAKISTYGRKLLNCCFSCCSQETRKYITSENQQK